MKIEDLVYILENLQIFSEDAKTRADVSKFTGISDKCKKCKSVFWDKVNAWYLAETDPQPIAQKELPDSYILHDIMYHYPYSAYIGAKIIKDMKK